MTPTNIHILYDALTKESISVSFEKADGSITNQVFTLNPSFMPKAEIGESTNQTPQTVESAVEKDVIVAWSLTKESWRSFKPSRVIGCNVKDNFITGK